MIFRGKYWFLSNMSTSRITINGYTYLNAEAAFQAQKCPGRESEFINLSGKQAKALGRRVKLREDWSDIRTNVMYSVVLRKFKQNLHLAELLRDTGVITITEDNTWGDKYWGVYKGVGQNKLGKILMRVREEIRN